MSNELKCAIDASAQDLDPGVVPMVKFFNKRGLKTKMSCEGHEDLNMSLFWISFDDSVIEDDIVRFMAAHQTTFVLGDYFVANGRFAENINLSMTGRVTRTWMYLAANVKAAHKDLKHWASIESGESRKRDVVLAGEFYKLGYSAEEASRLGYLADSYADSFGEIELDKAVEIILQKFEEDDELSFLINQDNTKG